MKRLLPILFSLLLVLSFSGCSAPQSQPETEAPTQEKETETLRTIRQAEALELEGRHREAMELLQQLVADKSPVPQSEPVIPSPVSSEPSVETVAESVPEAAAEPAPVAISDAADLIGTWKALSGKTIWEFREDGILSISSVDPGDLVIRQNRACPYLVSGSTVTIDGAVYTLSLQEDGVEILTGPEGSTSFVKESQFSQAITDVAITLDNWQTYFELRAANDVTVNKQGKITELRPGFGLFLKPEYVHRYIDGDAAFICTYTKIDMDYQWTVGTVDYRFDRVGEYLLNDGSHYDCRIQDMRPLNLPESSDYAGSVSVPVGYGELILPEGRTVYPESVKILEVFGSIILAK